MTIKLRNKFAQPLGFCTVLALALTQVTPAQAQYTAKEWPEGHDEAALHRHLRRLS